MMGNGFDTAGLDRYTARLLAIVQRDLPKEARTFVRQEGNELRKKTAALAKQRVKKGKHHKGSEAKRYHKGIKRGKVYVYKGNGGTAVRVYNSAPHAHLIESGHRIVDKNKKEHGFQPGRHVFEDAGKAFEQEFYRDIDAFLDKLWK